MVAIAQGRFGHRLELLGVLVEQQPEILAALVLAAQAGQHPQQLLGALFGAGGHLLHHLTAGIFLDVEGGIVQLVCQREPGLEQGLAEELHQPGQNGTQMLGADIVLALAAGGQVEDDLLVQGKVGQRFPRIGRDAGAHHGVFPGGFFAADPDGVAIAVGRGDVPLHLLRRGGNAARPAGRDAQAAVGAGIPVLDEVGAGEDLIAIGADVLAGCAGGAVGVQVPALLAVHLGVGGLHQRVHGVARKDTHRITPFQGPSPW